MNLEPSEIFKVLGVETRVKIVELLKSKGPLGSKNIAEIFGITPSAISQHLKILRQAGLVKSERAGYYIPYSINEEMLECCREMLEDVCTCGCRNKCGSEEKKLNTLTLEELKRYQGELKNKLKIVQKRIKEME